MDIGKASLYVATGMENVLGVVNNDETIFGSRKVRVKLISATLLLSKKMLQTFLVGFSWTQKSLLLTKFAYNYIKTLVKYCLYKSMKDSVLKKSFKTWWTGDLLNKDLKIPITANDFQL